MALVYAWSMSPAVRAALDAFAVKVRGRFGTRLRELVVFGSQARARLNAGGWMPG